MTDTVTHLKNPFNSDFLKTVATQPGVYLIKDKAGRTIYVGKARNLRKRLTSYARISVTSTGKVSLMVARSRNIEIIITNTEKEALILEALLIKKQKPRYNIDLRDDKSYPLIKVTVGETWPRLLITRRRIKDGSRYFGPYSSAAAMRESINYLNSLFPLRRCKRRKFSKRSRPCLNFQMDRCLAPCAGNVDHDHYMDMVQNVIMVLEGKNKELIKNLKDEMKKNATRLDFEEAAQNRDRINALQKTLEKQVVVASHAKDQDVFGYASSGSDAAVSIIFVRQGMVSGQQSFHLTAPIGNDREIINETIKRYYSNDRQVPEEILLPFVPEDRKLLNEWLDDMGEGRVVIKVPKSGDRFKLLEFAFNNARQVFAEQDRKLTAWEGLASELSTLLRLGRIPERIECLDISNIGGKQAVGSIVCFVRGKKKKSEYRYYKIRSVKEADDYQMMAEVLTRRFGKNTVNKKLPDLLLLDGGKGQLSVAFRMLAEFNLSDKIELAGIAKERAGQRDRLYCPVRKNPIKPARHSPVLLYLMRIRDESHRFAVNLHRKLRLKDTLSSKLDQIHGIGPVKKKALLTALGSLKRINNSSVEELVKVSGINRALAKAIVEAGKDKKF